MNYRLKNLLTSFLAFRLTRQVKELFSSTLIFNFAVALVAIFEPVFLYLVFIKDFNLTRTLQLIFLFYLAVYFIYFFALPLGGKFVKKLGYEWTIAVSTVFSALFYFVFFGISYCFWLIIPAVFLYVISKTLYWPAYHSNFASFSVDGQQGREVSNLVVLQSVVYVFGPLAGGFILKFFNYQALFIMAGILMILSNIPMLITREKFRSGSFPYWEIFQEFWRPANRKRLFSFLGFGEELIVLVIWPIFIYVIVRDFLGLGALSAVSILVTTVVFFYIGRISDRRDRRLILGYGAIFQFFSWLIRLFTRSVFGVFVIDVYSRISKQAVVIPMIAEVYEEAQDRAVVRSILFFEMSLVLGKILALVLGLLLLEIFIPGWNALFLLAALFTLCYLFFDF